MLGFSLLDVILLLVLLFYLISGLRKGLVVTLGGIVGFVAGAVAAFFAIPLVATWVPDEGWRAARWPDREAAGRNESTEYHLLHQAIHGPAHFGSAARAIASTIQDRGRAE